VFSRNQSLVQVSTTSVSMQLTLHLSPPVYWARMDLKLSVRSSASDVASANRFCVRTIQIVGVRWP